MFERSMKTIIMVIALILWGVFFYTELRAEDVSNAELLEEKMELNR